MKKFRMFFDKQGNPWELIQRYFTNNYTYCYLRNILTNEETCVTDWGLRKHFFEIL